MDNAQAKEEKAEDDQEWTIFDFASSFKFNLI